MGECFQLQDGKTQETVDAFKEALKIRLQLRSPAVKQTREALVKYLREQKKDELEAARVGLIDDWKLV